MSTALDWAEQTCRDQGRNLTPMRRRVLEILLESHRALGAYDVLERLSAEGKGAQPPTAYRALDFLVAIGAAHRIHRLNAFVACCRPADGHRPVFLICETCHRVDEAEGLAAQTALEEAASARGFAIDRTTLEAAGECTECRNAE
ncbi:MAG: Fur family transcriptional regulator [Pseudomonadota bacterium]